MKTILLNQNEIEKAAKILNNGGTVAIPTETVYGLAASAFNEKAVKKIFEAKGRPTDNPLIVHISNLDQLNSTVRKFPKKAKLLAQKFWPGPLTIILPKKENVLDIITSGLDTVAVRFPSHKITLNIISKTGPLVAPSANTSGKPSPTSAKHVMEDLEGKIDAIIDGGKCSIGVESTVISLAEEIPLILRPGAVTPKMIEEILGEVRLSHAVQNELKESEKVISPGMKHKHYSPKAKVIIIEGNNYVEFLNKKDEKNIVALCYNEDMDRLKIPFISLGSKKNFNEQAKNLFKVLREVDKKGFKTAYARCPSKDELGLAVYNRLLRASSFQIQKAE